MRAAPGARWALAAVVGILAFGTVASAGNAERDDPYYPGCVDRGYIRAREGALFELNNNVERLQASPAVLRRFQQGTRLALHMDERNLQSLNITNLDDMPTTDIIELFDLPVTSNIEEGWCTRILDIFMSLFFRRVVDLKFASKLWLDIDADLPVSAKMAERIFSSPSSVGWPEGDAAMDRFYKIRKSTLALLAKDRETRMEANALAAHGQEVAWEEMSAEFRGVMGDDEPKAPPKKTKAKKKKKAKKPPPTAEGGEEQSKFVSLDDNAPKAEEGEAAAAGEGAAAGGAGEAAAAAGAAGGEQAKAEL